MTRKLLTGNVAAAWGARLADVDYVPAFPITPQTEIIETLARWYERGEAGGRLTMLESEHSMLTAAAPAAVTIECSDSSTVSRPGISPRSNQPASVSMISVCGVIGNAGT